MSNRRTVIYCGGLPSIKADSSDHTGEFHRYLTKKFLWGESPCEVVVIYPWSYLTLLWLERAPVRIIMYTRGHLQTVSNEDPTYIDLSTSVLYF